MYMGAFFPFNLSHKIVQFWDWLLNSCPTKPQKFFDQYTKNKEKSYSFSLTNSCKMPEQMPSFVKIYITLVLNLIYTSRSQYLLKYKMIKLCNLTDINCTKNLHKVVQITTRWIKMINGSIFLKDYDQKSYL